MASSAAEIAPSGSRARPRLVWSTVPVRLNTGRKVGVSSCANVCMAATAKPVASAGARPARVCSRASSSALRMALTVAACPKRARRRQLQRLCAAPHAPRKLGAGDRAMFVHGNPRSIAKQEGVLAAPLPPTMRHQHVEPKRCNVIGKGIERVIVDLIENLHHSYGTFRRSRP